MSQSQQTNGKLEKKKRRNINEKQLKGYINQVQCTDLVSNTLGFM